MPAVSVPEFREAELLVVDPLAQSNSGAVVQLVPGPFRERLPRKPDGNSVAENVWEPFAVKEYTMSGPPKLVAVQNEVELSLRRPVIEPDTVVLPAEKMSGTGPVQLSPVPPPPLESDAVRLNVPDPAADALSTQRKYVPAARGMLVMVALAPEVVAALQVASAAPEHEPAPLRDRTGRQVDIGDVGVTVALNT